MHQNPLHLQMAVGFHGMRRPPVAGSRDWSWGDPGQLNGWLRLSRPDEADADRFLLGSLR